MKYLRTLLAICLLMALCCPALAETAETADTTTTFEPLPWLDETGKRPAIAPYLPNPENYLPDQGGYHDESLDIRLETSY